MNQELYTSYNILKKVYQDGAYAGVELNKLNMILKDDINTALVMRLVYGVLERDIYLEYVLKHFIKPNTKESIKIILKIGAYVKDNIDSIPPFACVNELVNITKKYESKYMSGFVNATLKNIYKKTISLPNPDTLEYLSVKYSYPLWLVKKLISSYGKDFTHKYLKKDLSNLTHIRVIDIKNTSKFIKRLQDLGIVYTPSCDLPYTFYVDFEKLLKQKDLEKKYVVQGLPSILTALALDVVEKEQVLDLCAAPGGKSVLIAHIANDAKIIANDIYAHKEKLIQSYANKYNIKNITTNVHDATQFNKEWQDKFDKVLADVPCSNTGIINKKPDILITKKPEQLNQLIHLQKQILENAAKYVKLGGTLIYSTCSILKEENSDIVKQFLNKNQNFSLQQINTFGIDVVKDTGAEFYPHISKTEGFYIAKLTRTK